MKITEKLYIERLEGMVKEYKDNLCSYCPMCKDYDPCIGRLMVEDSDYYSISYKRKSCNICITLIDKYASVECERSILTGYCPCSYFREYFKGAFGIEAQEMPKDYMIKVAWKVIRGWKKERSKQMRVSKKLMINNLIGKTLLFLRFKYKCSSNICDDITYGYGRLDDNGFWQFPIYKKEK